MAFDADVLRYEVESMFQHLTPNRDGAGLSEHIFPPAERGLNRGFRVFIPNPVATPERKKYKAGWNGSNRDERRRAGLCTECGGTTGKPFVLCEGCRETARKRVAARRSSGIILRESE